MKLFVFVVGMFVALHAFAQGDPIRAAIDLVDQGRIDEGIAILKTVVASDPANTKAQYELGLAYAKKGDNASCIATLQPVADKEGSEQLIAMTNLASCLDSAGQPDKAIAMYQRALKLEPDDSSVLFNLAVTLAGQNKFNEARELLKRDTEKHPSHASGQLLLGYIFKAQRYNVPALFAYLHFLALEPASKRSPQAIAAVWQLLNFGVEKKDEKNTNITFDVSAPKDEGDYGSVALMMAMSSALREGEKNKKLTQMEKVQSQIATLISVFAGKEDNHHTDYTARVQRPFFTEMQEKKLIEPFVWHAFAVAKVDGSREWQEKHPADLERWVEWITPQLDKPHLMLGAPGK